MHFSEVSITNFKGIKKIHLSDLGSLVVVAGPNGCGKSTILDAIRVFKSSYGSYVRDEISHLMNELQMSYSTQTGLVRYEALAQNKTQPVTIEATITITDAELHQIIANLENILFERILSQTYNYNPEMGQYFLKVSTEQELQVLQETARSQARELYPLLERKSASGVVQILQNGQLSVQENALLNFIFSTYNTEIVGIIDFLSADRQLMRQQTSGLNLNIFNSINNLKGSALYNTANKYNSITQEMANSYVRRVLREKEGIPVEEDSLWSNVTALFKLFFPDKELLEPRLSENGELAFLIRTAGGFTHDINELSSGEKEILMGYLRLYNSSLKNSVLLFDEPELHLNPRLVHELPNFYNEHIGKKSNNQIWFITHSDALLKTAVDEPTYSVFHVVPADQIGDDGNQAYALTTEDNLEKAIANLVGISSYVREAKVVFLEGEDSEVDKDIIETLYPDFAKLVNIVSAGAKRIVRQTHDLLSLAAEEAGFTGRFYSIVDKDADGEAYQQVPEDNRFVWDVYHIENYLLESPIIHSVLEDTFTRLPAAINTPIKVEEILKTVARQVSSKLVNHRIQVHVTQVMSGITAVGIRPGHSEPGKEFAHQISQKNIRLAEALSNELSQDSLIALEQTYRDEISRSFENQNWKKVIPGREILKQFVTMHAVVRGKGISYDVFRNLIRAKMASQNFRPEGMTLVLKNIEESIE